MTYPATDLIDLPAELILMILRNLNNIDVLYSLIGVERLDLIAKDRIFTHTLDFVSMSKLTVNRFCRNILPQIQYNIRCLVVESTNMKQILSACNYPNLIQLKIFDFNQDILTHFTDREKSSLYRLCKQQIKDLTLMNIDYSYQRNTYYTTHVYIRILTIFKKLNCLNIVQQYDHDYPALSLDGLPSNTIFSTTLTKLNISVYNFTNCLRLLDGFLPQLSTFIVVITNAIDDSVPIYISNDLIHLKCFSLTYEHLTDQYKTQIVPLIRRMFYLEELTLYLTIENETQCIDETDLENDIVIHTPQLHTFIFYIHTKIIRDSSIDLLFNNHTQRPIRNNRLIQVDRIMQYLWDTATYHIFSIPFTFNCIEPIGNTFPNIIFRNVTKLCVQDKDSFEHDFFLRLSRCFPSLKSLHVTNFTAQSNINQTCSILQHPHLITLYLMNVHIDYVEQFLNESITRLPRLTELHVDYDQLQIATENFTRETTRLNCTKVKQLICNQARIYPKDLYRYFPSL